MSSFNLLWIVLSVMPNASPFNPLSNQIKSTVSARPSVNFSFWCDCKTATKQGNQSRITQTLLLHSQKKLLQNVLHHALQLRISRHCTQFTCVIIGYILFSSMIFYSLYLVLTSHLKLYKDFNFVNILIRVDLYL